MTSVEILPGYQTGKLSAPAFQNGVSQDQQTKSAETIILKHRPKLLLELNENTMVNFKVHYSWVLKFLDKMNYKIYFVDKYPKILNRELIKNEVLNVYCETIY